MICSITIVRYPKWLAFAGILSMAIFRLPLLFNSNISFSKLMGSGKNGSFDKVPDLRQWALLSVHKNIDQTSINNNNNHSELLKRILGRFIVGWWKFWACEIWTIFLEPMEGHGKWDNLEPFGEMINNPEYEGKIAVLTRATIRLHKMNSFWKNVPLVANHMNQVDGFINSFGIGEIPWIKQATFSIWESKTAMRNFAYKMQEHATVIKKTKKENWYSEEMFIRFKPLVSFGTLKGIDPLFK